MHEEQMNRSEPLFDQRLKSDGTSSVTIKSMTALSDIVPRRTFKV